jgi:hypothetical protein
MSTKWIYKVTVAPELERRRHLRHLLHTVRYLVNYKHYKAHTNYTETSSTAERRLMSSKQLLTKKKSAAVRFEAAYT